MKLIEIPYSPLNLFLFISDKERADFNNKVQHQYPEWVDNKDADAMHFQNHIFIEDITEKETLIHEVYHFLEWLFEYMEIENESEFKACISSHIICKVLL